MIVSLRLQNFRGFGDHTIRLRNLTILVGRNNAGKSTIVEALTLVSLVANRFQHSTFKTPPIWSDLPLYSRGITPSLKGTDISLEGNVFHNFNDPPAIITASFNTKESITIYVGPEGQIFALIKNEEGKLVMTKSEALRVQIPEVSVLPQVGPLDPSEVIKSRDYVLRSLSTALAPLHFRNQLHYLDQKLLGVFRELAETSWKGLRIRDLDRVEDDEGDRLMLWVQDGEFVAEIGWMGHGLQMWLQVMWFLTRTPASTTVILDEPDVYMHPDLQRRLIRLLKGRYAQTIVATHSVEILAEVDPRSVLVIDKTRRQSTYAANVPAVQQVIDHIGGVHNVHLARLASARRFLLMEGKEITYLEDFQNAVSTRNSEPIGAIPRGSIEGFSNWKYAIGSAMAFRNAADELIKTYCILDRDYHLDDEIAELLQEAARFGLNLHVWCRKEIENYLLVPTAIQRVIAERIRKGKAPDLESIEDEIDRITLDMHDTVLEGYVAAIQARGRRDSVLALREARAALLERKWDNPVSRRSIVSGKQILSRLSAWSSTVFGVSFGAEAISKELLRSEVDTEVAMVIQSVETGADFTTRDEFLRDA